MNYEEQWAKLNEQELWLEEQAKKHEVKVNINWKNILKKAKENDNITHIPG